MQPEQALVSSEPKSRHLGRGHLPALDGIRGLAILAVAVSHFLSGNFSAAGPRGIWFGKVFALGAHGVDLFFVLSGFLITGILRDSIKEEHYFQKFYARRVLRIFPLYYGVLLLLMAFTVPLGLHWGGSQFSYLLYLQNTSILPSTLDSGTPPYVQLDHLWSLAVEEQFYLVWPLLTFLIRSSRRLFAICCIGIAGALVLRLASLAHGATFTFVNRNTLCRMDALLVGAALALLMRSRYADRVTQWAWVVALLTLVAALANAWTTPAGIGPYVSVPAILQVACGFSIIALCSAAALAAALRVDSLTKRAFEEKRLRFFGKYSYGFYVLHFLPVPALVLLLEPLRNLGASPMLARLAIAVFGFTAAIVAAYLVFHLYEKRFLRLKRFFDYAPRHAPDR